jgi:hypothetical protein
LPSGRRDESGQYHRATRLAGGPGEILITTDAAKAADLDPTLEHRDLGLRGKHAATEVVAIRVGPSGIG